ncbi:MAG: L-lactate dehydrogenase, partial [Huintestinicola sp.]
MSNKVTIIGAGSVGSTIAYTMVVDGIASEIVLVDINENKALGEAMDIVQGVPFCSPCSIYAGSYEDAKDSDVVILTSGVARKPGQSRLELAQTNVNITKSIIPQIVKYAPNAIYIIVSNPIDILTYQFIKTSGLPANHIIGSGTTLDTSRLRTGLAETFNISQQNVHAYVFGEHGDSSFVPWSLANVSSIPIDQYIACLPEDRRPSLDYAAIEEY